MKYRARCLKTSEGGPCYNTVEKWIYCPSDPIWLNENVGFHPAFSRHDRAEAKHLAKKEKVGFSRQGNSNSSILSLFSVGHAVTIPDRNNYANNDVGILYRLYLMYLMYVHNYSAQSVDSSERMIVMLCAYSNSFPYRIFIVFYF